MAKKRRKVSEEATRRGSKLWDKLGRKERKKLTKKTKTLVEMSADARILEEKDYLREVLGISPGDK